MSLPPTFFFKDFSLQTHLISQVTVPTIDFILRDLSAPTQIHACPSPLFYPPGFLCASTDSCMSILSVLFSGISLYEHMQSCKYLPLDLVLIARIMTSLLSALAHLHALDIVYLNWTSKYSMLFYLSCFLPIMYISNTTSPALSGEKLDRSASGIGVHR